MSEKPNYKLWFIGGGICCFILIIILVVALIPSNRTPRTVNQHLYMKIFNELCSQRQTVPILTFTDARDGYVHTHSNIQGNLNNTSSFIIGPGTTAVFYYNNDRNNPIARIANRSDSEVCHNVNEYVFDWSKPISLDLYPPS